MTWPKIIACADGVCTGTADLVALECIRCHTAKAAEVRQGIADHGRGTHEPDRPGMGNAEDDQSLLGMEKGLVRI